MKTDSELLREAATIISERGMCRNTLLRESDGRVCLIGALNIAHHGNPLFSTNDRVFTQLRLRLNKFIRMDPADWNNTKAKDTDDVVHMLKLAAEHFEVEDA